MLGLLLEADHPAVGVELGHAVALGVLDVVAEDRRPLGVGGDPLELLAEAVAVEDVVAEDQGDRVVRRRTRGR